MFDITGLLGRQAKFKEGERKNKFGEIVGGYIREGCDSDPIYLIISMKGDNAGELVCVKYNEVRLG